MDYEQKYKEALERANELIQLLEKHPKLNAGIADIHEIFPELAESEDERIRKFLCKIVDNLYPKDFDTVKKVDVLAWLEKQKDKMTAEEFESSELFQLKLKTKYANGYQDGLAQKEQKPVSTEDGPYITDEHFYEREPADSFKYKLAEYMTKNYRKVESPDGYTYHINSESILEMAKEELLKRGIVQKPVENTTIYEDAAKKYFDPWIEKHRDSPTKWGCFWEGLLYSRKLQKPVEWSEDDKQNLLCVCGLLKHYLSANYKGSKYWDDAQVKEWIEWTKNLPNRFNLQPKQGWNEEEKMDIELLIALLRGKVNLIEILDSRKELIISFLKSLRPQPKVELSEDVKKTLDEVSHILVGLNYKQIAKDYKQAIERLLSLRPSWKPSEINSEEVRLLDTTISFLKDFADKGYENAVECIDWLKSKRNGTARK